MIKIHLLCKRYYTNKDLLKDRFGRLYHLPVQLTKYDSNISVSAIDYRNRSSEMITASGVTFHGIPATPTKLPGLIPKLYRIIKDNGVDILIASGDSHIGYIGLKIARRLGVPFVYDVYDYYPAFLSNRIPGMKAMFNSAVQNADQVLCASESLKEYLVAHNSNILLIENGVDRTLFTPSKVQQARKVFGFEESVQLVGYFGSITPARGPLLIDACRKLQQHIPSLRLLLAGKVSNVVINEPWITYLGELPQEAIPDLIRACDVVTVPYRPDSFNSMAGACKIAEYLACGKPVVATRISGHEQIFKAAPESLCEPNPEDMARALLGQLKNPVIVPFPESMDWQYIGQALHKSLIRILA